MRTFQIRLWHCKRPRTVAGSTTPLPAASPLPAAESLACQKRRVNRQSNLTSGWVARASGRRPPSRTGGPRYRPLHTPGNLGGKEMKGWEIKPLGAVILVVLVAIAIYFSRVVRPLLASSPEWVVTERPQVEVGLDARPDADEAAPSQDASPPLFLRGWRVGSDAETIRRPPARARA